MKLDSVKQQVDRSYHLRFRLGIWLYQKTGYLTSFVRDAEEDYIENNLNKFLKQYNRSKSLKKEFTFSCYVGLQRGMWQAEKGLYRSLSLPRTRIGKFFYNSRNNLRRYIISFLDKYKI